MSIRWTRARRQTLPKTPKSPDNPLKSTKPLKHHTPKAPKTRPATQRKRTFQPVLPGAGKPGVKRQFIHTNFEDFLSRQAYGVKGRSGNPEVSYSDDTSGEAINEIYRLTNGPNYELVALRWNTNPHNPTGARCPLGSQEHYGSQPICVALGEKKWGSWQDLISAMNTAKTRGHTGMWAVSHVDCDCTITALIRNTQTGDGYLATISPRSETRKAFIEPIGDATEIADEGFISDPSAYQGKSWQQAYNEYYALVPEVELGGEEGEEQGEDFDQEGYDERMRLWQERKKRRINEIQVGPEEIGAEPEGAEVQEDEEV